MYTAMPNAKPPNNSPKSCFRFRFGAGPKIFFKLHRWCTRITVWFSISGKFERDAGREAPAYCSVSEKRHSGLKLLAILVTLAFALYFQFPADERASFWREYTLWTTIDHILEMWL
jgi:hypothetical protein